MLFDISRELRAENDECQHGPTLMMSCANNSPVHAPEYDEHRGVIAGFRERSLDVQVGGYIFQLIFTFLRLSGYSKGVEWMTITVESIILQLETN